jgi:hypothetical protein
MERELRETRQEAAKHRVLAREANAKLAALGDAPAEVVKLKAENRELRVSNALTEQAIKAGANNVKLLRASLREDGLLASLDPDKADFAAAVEAMVETALENEPALRGQAPSNGPVRTGSDFSTNRAPGVELRQSVTPDDIAEMRARGDHEGIAKLVRQGLLNNVFTGGM